MVISKFLDVCVMFPHYQLTVPNLMLEPTKLFFLVINLVLKPNAISAQYPSLSTQKPSTPTIPIGPSPLPDDPPYPLSSLTLADPIMPNRPAASPPDSVPPHLPPSSLQTLAPFPITYEQRRPHPLPSPITPSLPSSNTHVPGPSSPILPPSSSPTTFGVTPPPPPPPPTPPRRSQQCHSPFSRCQSSP
ncbi:hypothetical protein PIB30_034499 [Stylosanthes scabra]|uniref:Uncharacterized protein n=1 Tax=Stylosanthes scabra TaxID=79078 RepID=A0ABU6XEL6_9FABA|nr:hypothetical protein [Stylosanthes scabra]